MTENISNISAPIDSLKYIDSLELPDLPESLVALKGYKPAAQTDQDASASVSAGSVIGFVAGLTAQQKQDVLNSTLLAQLNSNKLYDREKETVLWYANYKTVLENIGWVVSKFDFTKYQGGGSSLEISEVVVEILMAIATDNALLVTQAAMDALKALKEGSKGFKIWNETTHTPSNGNFLIAPCINSDNNVVMSLAAVYFSSKNVDTTFLWFHFQSSEIELYKGQQTITLNKQVYNKVRQKVIDKLGSAAIDYVDGLDISI